MFQVTVLAIIPPRKPSCLAEASVRIALDDGESVVVNDLRIIRNRAGVVWVALPTFSVKEGNGYRYEPTVELGRALKRAVEDAVLPAFEKWQREQGSAR